MGEEWGKNNLIKFLLTARDTGLAPLDMTQNVWVKTK